MPPPPPPPQRPAPSRAGRANLFSSPPPPLPNRRNPQHRPLPLPPLAPRRRHPKNHDEQPSHEQEPTAAGPRTTNPAFRAPHLRTAYRKPVPPAAAAGKGEALLAADPTDAAAGRAVVVGPSGLSFRLPDAPFDFQFSYSEAPRAPPLAIREPAFLPFAPPTMPRPWTGKAPLLTKEEKARRRGVLAAHAARAGAAEDGERPRDHDGDEGEEAAGPGQGEPRRRQEPGGSAWGAAHPCRGARARQTPYLAQPAAQHRRRDGLTHNMLEMIHCHWRRQEICKVRCRGVPTVDMNNLCYHLEEKSGGKIIHRVGGVVFLYRGRNYDPRTRPRYPLMLWKPATPVYPNLIQEAPEGLTKEEADEMRRKGRDLLPICKLAKNGIYITLVKDVRDAFEANDLVKIDCEGLNPSDYKKIGAKLRDLVPCVLLSFDNEQILMYRGKEWKSRYSKPLTLIPKVPKNNPSVSPDLSSSDTVEATDAKTQVAIREVLGPKMFKLWKSAVESSLALVLDDSEVNGLTPDSLLTRVEEFSVTSQAVEHSFPALLMANGDGNPEVLSAELMEDESETGSAGHQEDQHEQSPDHSDDEHFEHDMFECLESSAPLGSLPIDTMVEQLNSE
ncbi:hypothetical protein ACP70R_037529 [Stipagrostis hirtigluma subsp. patula]